jgi:hypothetical protein
MKSEIRNPKNEGNPKSEGQRAGLTLTVFQGVKGIACREKLEPRRGGLFIDKPSFEIFFLFFSGAAFHSTTTYIGRGDFARGRQFPFSSAPLKNKKKGWGGLAVLYKQATPTGFAHDFELGVPHER